MTSSRRSTRSSSSVRSPPHWRTITQPKNTPSTDLSLVFAQPENAVSLSPASAKLTLSRRASASTLASREPRSPPPLPAVIDGEMVASGSGLGLEQLQELEENRMIRVAEEVPIMPEESVTTQANVTLPVAAEDALPVIAIAPPTPMLEAAPRSSWFGSLGRAKGKQKVVELQNEPMASIPSSPPNDTIVPLVQPQAIIDNVDIPPVPEPRAPPATIVAQTFSPSSSPPRPIPQHKRRSWFSTSSTVFPRAGTSPTVPSPLNTSIPSSIDEEVPIHAGLPTLESSPGIVESPPNDDTVRARLNSLNPSSPRFSLSIPLLGRAKIPLEHVVSSDVFVGSEQAPNTMPGPIATAIIQEAIPIFDSPVAEAKPDPPTAGTDAKEAAATEPSSGEAEPTPRPHAMPESSSSWWDYVGWSSNTDLAAYAPTQQPPEPSLPNPGVPPNDPIPKEETVISEPPAAEEQQVMQPPTSATSIRSAETSLSQAPSVAGSAWYSPWGWYGGSPVPTAPATATDLGDVSSSIEGLPKTESELVKEEALARDDPLAPPASSEAAPAPATVPDSSDSNPIAATITSNRSGWASFFTSRSMVMSNKMIEEEVQRDENGAEIMVIEEDPPTNDEPAKAPESAPVEPPKKSLSLGFGSIPGSSAVSLLSLGQKEKSPTRPAKSEQSTPAGEPRNEKANKNKPAAPPLTVSDSVKKTVQKSNANKRKASTSASAVATPPMVPGTPSPTLPNLVLPSWSDTFHTVPRSAPPPVASSKLSKTIRFMSGVLFPGAEDAIASASKAKHKSREFSTYGQELPRAFDVFPEKLRPDVLRGAKRVVVIGIHGWFPGAMMRSMLGEPTGTSGKFVSMMIQALEEFQEEHSVKLDKITAIPLEGEGTIQKRVEKLYASLLGNQEWVDDLHAADVVFVATHSQGSVVSTHLLDRLLRDQHLRVSTSQTIGSSEVAPGPATLIPPSQGKQRVCCLALCGIHLGPLRYLSSSTLVLPYIQYFESAAARELFEFQNTDSDVSKEYVKALGNVLDHEVKMVYVASLDDQVVPIYSGIFTAASHPLILRALYIDGDAYHSSDFLSNLLVLLLRVLNTGLTDSGLLTHLSEATAGSLNGVGHSTAYEEIGTYKLAVKYLFLTNEGSPAGTKLHVDSFNAATEQNDYEIPWALRDLIADERMGHFFSEEIGQLRDAFQEWHPKTAILRDIKKKLQPIQRLPSSLSTSSSSSKL